MGNAGTQLTVVCMHPALVDWVTAGIEDGQHWYSAHSCVHACSPGWLVHWGEKMANTGTQLTVVCMHAALICWFTTGREDGATLVFS